jgi:hypothetical protein
MGTLALNFSGSKPFMWARFSLNNQANQTTTGDATGLLIPSLNEGKNNITVYAIDDAGNVGASEAIHFTMIFLNSPYDTPSPISPVITVTSPKNTTYNEGDITLIFSVDNPVSLFGATPKYPNVSWVGYSLDGQNNMTLHENTTLAGMPKGDHNITVYANDTYGNIGSSQAIFFEITPEAFSTASVAAILAISAVALGAGFLVYIKKYKH